MERAQELIENSLLWDMVLPYEPAMGNDVALLHRWHEAGFSFVSMHPAGDRHGIAEAMVRIAGARAAIASDPDRFVLMERFSDIRQAQADGKLAVGLHLEGTQPLERNVELLEVYHALGVRFLHPVFNLVNFFGGGCADRTDPGLTLYGLRVIEEMNRLGMLLDAAHAGHRTTLEMIEASSDPVVFTHNAIDAVEPHFRNVKDDQIKACAASGGVIGITGGNNYLGGDATPETLFRHIDHVASLVGPEHVGLGFDVVVDTQVLDDFVRDRRAEWGDRDWPKWRFFDVDDMGGLVQVMLDHGYSDEAVRGVLGGNFMRVCEQVWS